MMPNPPTWISAEDHHLAEARPVHRGVHHDQPGHAHRGGRGEQRGQQRSRPGPSRAIGSINRPVPTATATANAATITWAGWRNWGRHRTRPGRARWPSRDSGTPKY